jgi:Domain of unknown function (DUF4337)
MSTGAHRYDKAEVNILTVERSTVVRLSLIIVYILVLVIALLFSGIGINRSGKVATSSNLEGANYWNEFLDATFRQTLLRMHVQNLEIIAATEPRMSDSGRAKIRQRELLYRRELSRLESDPGSRGRRELREKAERVEAVKRVSICQNATFATAYAILQLAIGLGAIAVVLSSVTIWCLSGLLGFVGLFFTISGFLSFAGIARDFMCASGFGV